MNEKHFPHERIFLKECYPCTFSNNSCKDHGRVAYQGRTGSTKLGLNWVNNVDVVNRFGMKVFVFFKEYGSCDTPSKNSGSEQYVTS